MSAAELRQAAALMRERAEAATGDRWGWRHFGDDPESSCRVVYYPPLDSADQWQVVADDLWHEPDATHIASWHPAVALAVAEWLDGVALYVEAKDDEEWFDLDGDPIAPEDTHAIGSALKVARAYLGSAS